MPFQRSLLAMPRGLEVDQEDLVRVLQAVQAQVALVVDQVEASIALLAHILQAQVPDLQVLAALEVDQDLIVQAQAVRLPDELL